MFHKASFRLIPEIIYQLIFCFCFCFRALPGLVEVITYKNAFNTISVNKVTEHTYKYGKVSMYAYMYIFR